jgi:adenosylhomocysteinase
MRAKGLGAKVVVTEIDPIKAVEAHMDGFTVLPMAQAAPLGDCFLTVTGCRDVIDAAHYPAMKDGAILANAGHFDVEVNVEALRRLATQTRETRKNITGYQLPGGKWVYVLAQGRLVNLAAGDGHPAEIMDMSFAIQALCARWLAQHRGQTVTQRLMAVPRPIDMLVARRKLEGLGVAIDPPTPAQRAYMGTDEDG